VTTSMKKAVAPSFPRRRESSVVASMLEHGHGIPAFARMAETQ